MKKMAGWNSQGNIQNIILFGNKYPEKIRKNIKNRFSENVTTACQSMQNKLSTNNTWAFNIPLWYNSLINFEFRNKWYKQEIVWVIDILDNKGELVSI